MALILADTLPLIEPVPIDDELCSGLALIEDVSGIACPFRILSYADALRGRRHRVCGEEESRVALWSDSLRREDDGRVHGASDRRAADADRGAIGWLEDFAKHGRPPVLTGGRCAVWNATESFIATEW
jgi:hypothetical protein